MLDAAQLPKKHLVHIAPHLLDDVIRQVPDELVGGPLIS